MGEREDMEMANMQTSPLLPASMDMSKEYQDVDTHPVFSELAELKSVNGQESWRETARWVKYEENVEEGADRWSKPHIATVTLHSILELRNAISNGSVLLDVNAYNFNDLASIICDHLIKIGDLKRDERNLMMQVLLKKHQHQYERREQRKRSKSVKNSYEANGKQNGVSINSQSSAALTQEDVPDPRVNESFLKKLPAGSEANNILVGEVDFLQKPIAIFVRLNEPKRFDYLTEVPVETRFVFIYVGKRDRVKNRYKNVGRAMASIMSDKVFSSLAYKAQSKEDMLLGMAEYLDAVTVLPPHIWDPNNRIAPPEKLPTDKARLAHHLQLTYDDDFVSPRDAALEREQSGLTRTGRLFGGLINDVKRKAPWYLSDFKDGLSFQSIATVFFLYFACLTPIITFGGLLAKATGDNLAGIESLMSGAICGILYGLFSGQPLTIIGSTGPVLVFEGIIYSFTQQYGFHYLSFRLWIGLWTALILIIIVATDASAYVSYMTRFTQDNFAALIALIFIYEAICNIMGVGKSNPIHIHTADIEEKVNHSCSCIFDDETSIPLQDFSENSTEIIWCLSSNGTLSGDACEKGAYVPDVFLFSIILMFVTFTISFTLKKFKTAPYFSSKYRFFISDLAVPLAIFTVTILDFLIGIKTPKLIVPSEFKPTNPNRGWVVPIFAPENPVWLCFAAAVPAMLATILIFLDQQLTAVIVNRKENKLRKGCGYHLDLFVLACLIIICSCFGLPWFIAATVLAMTHVNTLRRETESAAPGERPQFLGVREQRITPIVIFSLVGLSIFFTPALRLIPMPVLFGVFLYMGTSSLLDSKFFNRIMLMFMPVKHQPDFDYLRKVPITRVHLFTLIQLACFLLLWIVKSIKAISITFPLILVVMIGVRKLLDFIFTRDELKQLDDLLPETPQEDDELKVPITPSRKEAVVRKRGASFRGNVVENELPWVAKEAEILSEIVIENNFANDQKQNP